MQMTELQRQLYSQIRNGKSVVTSSGDKIIVKSLVKKGLIISTPTIALRSGANVKALAVSLVLA